MQSIVQSRVQSPGFVPTCLQNQKWTSNNHCCSSLSATRETTLWSNCFCSGILCIPILNFILVVCLTWQYVHPSPYCCNLTAIEWVSKWHKVWALYQVLLPMVLAITQLISAITVEKEREKLLTSHQKGKKKHMLLLTISQCRRK